jgi:hypothetical protein
VVLWEKAIQQKCQHEDQWCCCESLERGDSNEIGHLKLAFDSCLWFDQQHNPSF